MIRQQNGLNADPAKWAATQRRAALKQQEKRRAAVEVTRTGQRTTLRRTPISNKKWDLSARERTGTGFAPSVRAAIHRRSGGRCEVALPGCLGEADQCHHRKLRRHRDNRRCNGLAVCASCHGKVHANVGLSYVKGWLVRSDEDPAMVSVQIQGEFRAYLTLEGRYASRLTSSPALVVSGLPEDGQGENK